LNIINYYYYYYYTQITHIKSNIVKKNFKKFFCVTKIKPHDILEISLNFFIIYGKIVV